MQLATNRELRLEIFFPLLALVCLLSSLYFSLVTAPAGFGAAAPTVEQGLFPEWLGCREILRGRDPYREEITRESQAAIGAHQINGAPAPRNQHRFAYPVLFAVPMAPLAVLPFAWAQRVALFSGVLLTVASVFLWLPREMLGYSRRLICLLLVFASYPFVLAAQLRQPTLLIAGLLAAAVYSFRSDRLAAAGILAAVCCSKPQLAIAVLLPLSVASLADWKRHRAFVLSFAATLGTLLLVSEAAVPHWLPQWVSTIRAYSHYAGSQPLLLDLLHGHLLVPAYLLLVGAAVYVSVRFHAADLLFTVSFSAATFQLLFPFQIYNEVMLLPAALWMAGKASEIKSRGQFATLIWSCTWIVVGSGWASAVALSLAGFTAPHRLPVLWQAPLLACYLYPFAVGAVMVVYAATSPERTSAANRAPRAFPALLKGSAQ